MSTQTIIPYLTVAGAAEAIALYAKAFGATEMGGRMPAEDGKRIMHAALTIKGGTVFLSDPFPEHDGTPAPTREKPAGVGIVIQVSTPAEVDATYKQAVGAGCTGTMEPHDAFWGARFAMLVDPFGHRWMLGGPMAQS
jgi:PhnB protein